MALRVRGVVYDVGTSPFPGYDSRPRFDPAQVDRDMAAIAADLGCTAVRLVGRDLQRLALAAERAQAHGLEVWLSPLRHDADAAELLTDLAEAARLAERLQQQGPVVLVVGWELTVFLRGLVTGAGVADRARTFSSPWRLALSTARHGSFNARLNAVLADACATARAGFSGPVTYAAGAWEQVDWSPFDVVAVDAYRDRGNRDRFPELVRAWAGHGKPFVASETGCCTYRGARDRGSLAWTVVDRSTSPPRLDGSYERSEGEQAAEVAEVLDVLEGGGAAGAFVFTFAGWSHPHVEDDPAHDLDRASYGLVACRPDGSWRPKEAFSAVAARYRAPS